MKNLIKKALAGVALAFALPVVAVAQVQENFLRYEVLPGWRQADGTHMAAVRLTMAEGWHTYWRSPGDAGIPPQFRFGPSSNLTSFAVHWPVPEIFQDNGFNSVGYEGEVILPLRLRPETEGQPIGLKGEIQIGVCEEICVPVWLEIDATLSVAGQPDTDIQSALKSRPLTGREVGAGRASCTVEQITDGLRLTAVMDFPALSGREFAVVEYEERSIWISEARIERQGNTLTAIADMVPTDGKPFLLKRDGLVFTVLSDGKSVELSGCGAG